MAKKTKKKTNSEPGSVSFTLLGIDNVKRVLECVLPYYEISIKVTPKFEVLPDLYHTNISFMDADDPSHTAFLRGLVTGVSKGMAYDIDEISVD